MPLCKCQSCIEEVHGGKDVSASTYRWHRKQVPQRKRSAHIHCVCIQYPSGHFFHSRSAYKYHCRALGHERHDWSPHNIEMRNFYPDNTPMPNIDSDDLNCSDTLANGSQADGSPAPSNIPAPSNNPAPSNSPAHSNNPDLSNSPAHSK